MMVEINEAGLELVGSLLIIMGSFNLVVLIITILGGFA